MPEIPRTRAYAMYDVMQFDFEWLEIPNKTKRSLNAHQLMELVEDWNRYQQRLARADANSIENVPVPLSLTIEVRYVREEKA